jgi:ferrous iron transport protein B
MELGIPVIAALNIYDEAEQKGYKIETNVIEKALGVRAIPTVATKKKGLEDLLAAVLEVGDDPSANYPRSLNYGEDIEAAAGRVEQQIKKRYPLLAEKYPAKWLAFKLMEGALCCRRLICCSITAPLLKRRSAISARPMARTLRRSWPTPVMVRQPASPRKF